MKFLGKTVFYDNTESHQKPGLYPLSRKYSLWKTTMGGGGSNRPPSLFRVKEKTFSLLFVKNKVLSLDEMYGIKLWLKSPEILWPFLKWDKIFHNTCGCLIWKIFSSQSWMELWNQSRLRFNRFRSSGHIVYKTTSYLWTAAFRLGLTFSPKKFGQLSRN